MGLIIQAGWLMSRPANKYSQDKFEAAQKLLDTKAKNPKGYTVSELILGLAPEIKRMLAAGYNYEDVSDALAEIEIKIAASSIKKTLKELDKESAETITIPPSLEPESAVTEEDNAAVIDSKTRNKSRKNKNNVREVNAPSSEPESTAKEPEAGAEYTSLSGSDSDEETESLGNNGSESTVPMSSDSAINVSLNKPASDGFNSEDINDL
jgi:hypothetical protein